ncbi:MAG: acyl-CoA thioesterase [Gammaproteobacteria bacterium]
MQEFAVDMQVRDYECDLQGIVNNAVYQNYLEHARHQFLKTRDVDFVALTATGVHVMVIKAELNYLRSLRPGDEFAVSVVTERVSRLRMGFKQSITLKSCGTVVMNAYLTVAAIDARGKPCFPESLQRLLML